MDLVVRKARRQRLGEENPKQPLKHRLRAPLFYAGVLGLVLLLQETLYLVLKNPALLADLVNTYASLIAEHVAFAVFAGTFGALAFQSRAWGVASMAMLYYIIVSLRVLYFDAPMLSQTKLAVVFALLSAAFWYTLYRFYRSRRTHAVWVVGVVAFNALLRAIQYTWSSLGGAVGVFLSSFEPLAVVFLGAAMLLGVLFFIDRKNVRRGALAVAVALPCAIIALRSQATGATTESSDSSEPDIFVVSFDALRKDVYDEWCRQVTSQAKSVVCERAKQYETVFTDGTATYEILTRNIQAESGCDDSVPARLRKRGYSTAMYLGRKVKRIDGAECFDVYFSGAGDVILEQYTVPFLLRRLLGDFDGPRHKLVDTSDILTAFREHEPRFQGPVFTYFHLLDLHDPYLPRSLEGNEAHLRDLEMFRQRCHVEMCDLGLAENQALVNRMRQAYLKTLVDVEQHLSEVLELARQRQRPFRLILTADHGELFGEHGGILHSGGFVPELMRVPFAVYDSAKTINLPERDCRLMLTSEALGETLSTPIRAEMTATTRQVESGRLGLSTIDSSRRVIAFDLNEAAMAHRGTWRNLHATKVGEVPWHEPRCPE